MVSVLFDDLKKESKYDEDDFRSQFILQQEEALKVDDPRQRRWHPLIVRWCFQLHATSPKAYKMLQSASALILPSSRVLRDYSSCFKVDAGFHLEQFDRVKTDAIRRGLKPYEMWINLVHDEVSIRDDLVFDDAGRLVGVVDMGSVQNAIDDLEALLSNGYTKERPPDKATHMFVFMAVSLFSEWKMPLAYFPTTTIKSSALFNVVWECIEMLEEREFKVLVLTCDGATPHRKFYKMHHPPNTPPGTLIYKVRNPYAVDRFVYFLCDPVHLLKTTRNNWENSFWQNKTRKLKNNGQWITWLQLIDAYENDVNESNDSGLRIMHKLGANHLFLNPYLRMRVYLAAQVFSNRVAQAIAIQNRPGTQETGKFVKLMNDFFDCVSANNGTTQLEFKSVYRSALDRRLTWLEEDFLKYFSDWKAWAMAQEDVPLNERKQYFISDQTWEGLQIGVKSFVEVVRFALTIPGVQYVVGTKLNQDPLEKFFGKLRQKRGAYNAFNNNEFAQSFALTMFEYSHPIRNVRNHRGNQDVRALDPALALERRKRPRTK